MNRILNPFLLGILPTQRLKTHVVPQREINKNCKGGMQETDAAVKSVYNLWASFEVYNKSGDLRLIHAILQVHAQLD